MSVTAVPVSVPPLNRVDTSGFSGPFSYSDQREMAEFLAKAVATIPAVYRNRPADIFAGILQAQALNVPVMTALHNVVWDEALGKGALTAQLMAALLHRGGVGWTPRFGDDPKRGRFCEMVFTRHGKPAGDCKWELLEAVAAGIAGSHTWQYYTDDMLWARCLSRGARRFGSDLVAGFGYTLDELREIAADEPAGNDRAVAPDVAAFLAQVTDDTPAAKIQELTKFAARAKIGLADEYAGNQQTLAERLHTLWLAASAREQAGSADKAMAAPAPVVIPGAAAGSMATLPPATDSPAGEGDAGCGCPAARIIAGEGHDPDVCRNQAAGEPTGETAGEVAGDETAVAP